MTLEAMLEDLAKLPEQPEFLDFIASCSSALQTISSALRTRQPLPELPELREQQSLLFRHAQRAADTSTVELLARITDRMVDNINTLAHVVRRSERDLSTTALPA
jgi:hypothetical protein